MYVPESSQKHIATHVTYVYMKKIFNINGIWNFISDKKFTLKFSHFAMNGEAHNISSCQIKIHLLCHEKKNNYCTNKI